MHSHGKGWLLYDQPGPLLNGDEGISSFQDKKIGIERIMISVINTVSKVNVSMIEMYMYMPFRFRMHLYSNEFDFLHWDNIITLVCDAVTKLVGRH